MVHDWGSPDVLLINGDAIEGSQTRQGGAELITNDRNVQAEMARECFSIWNASEILMTYGTAYHVGDKAEDFEYNIARELNATIEGRLFFEIEGVKIDARHKIGSSSMPNGRAQALLRSIMWNLIKGAEKQEPIADIVIRSHVHYHVWVETPKHTAFTTPALQLSRGRYGSRECEGETHWGAIRLTLSCGEIIKKEKRICDLSANRPKLLKIR